MFYKLNGFVPNTFIVDCADPIDDMSEPDGQAVVLL